MNEIKLEIWFDREDYLYGLPPDEIVYCNDEEYTAVRLLASRIISRGGVAKGYFIERIF
jgi:hypothetical protein